MSNRQFEKSGQLDGYAVSGSSPPLVLRMVGVLAGGGPDASLGTPR